LRDLPDVEELLRHSPVEVFDTVVQRCTAALGGPVAVLLLDHLDLVDFCLTYAYPGSPSLLEQLPLRVEEGPLWRVAQGLEVVQAPVEEWQVRPLEDPYLTAAPIRLRDHAIGVLFFGSEEPPSERQVQDLRSLGMKSAVSIAVADQYTDMLETRRRRTTPSIAAELQSDQLPPRALYTPAVQVVGGIEPVYDVGGDWFDYSLDPERLFVAVCDGVGRGLTAASISYVTLGAVRNARKKGGSLREIAELAHESLISSTNYEQFATLLLVSIDFASFQMELISAAHPHPIIMPPAGSGPPEVLTPSHAYPPLGAFKGGEKYLSHTYDLEPGSRLVLFSDGAVEHRDEHGSQLGIEGLLRFVDETRGRVKMDFLRGMMRKIGEFCHSEIRDDITIVCVDLPPFE
jgi:serine phosphatase RsbU (regulator of sigma subunit)